ncbi:MAG: RidA family protein [Hyphomicrobiaceae bacterium]
MTRTSDNKAENSPEKKLAQIGLTLPPAPDALVSSYAPWAITGNLLMTSGQFSYRDGRLAYTGRMGGDLDEEQAYDACRVAALNGFAQIKAALGSLDRVGQILRLEGTMQVATGYRDHPHALNGASDLICDVFGDRGRHSRMIYTNPEMPLNAPVLLVFWVEIKN